jgi:hypothetical protein
LQVLLLFYCFAAWFLPYHPLQFFSDHYAGMDHFFTLDRMDLFFTSVCTGCTQTSQKANLYNKRI